MGCEEGSAAGWDVGSEAGCWDGSVGFDCAVSSTLICTLSILLWQEKYRMSIRPQMFIIRLEGNSFMFDTLRSTIT